MSALAAMCKWFGWTWLVLACAFILVNYASIIYIQGWSEFREIASPFNLVNFAAIVLTLLPGIGLLALRDHLQRKAADRAMRVFQKPPKGESPKG